MVVKVMKPGELFLDSHSQKVKAGLSGEESYELERLIDLSSPQHH
jgi:hypothetical protein